MNQYEVFKINKRKGDFIEFYNENPVSFYEEKDLLKEVVIEDMYGYEETILTLEHYDAISIISGYWVGYCYNSLPPFARAESCKEGCHSWLQGLNRDSSILNKNENGIRRIEIECPKIAYGFTAFLMTHTTIDKKGRQRYSINRKEVRLSVLMNAYLESQKTNYDILNKDDYSYNSINKLDDKNRTLDITFYESHIKQEEGLRSRTEQQGNNIAKDFICHHNEYIQFIEEELRKLNVVNFSKNNNNYNLPKYDDNLLFLFYNNEEVIDTFISRTQNMKGINVVNEILALRELQLIKPSKDVSNKQLHDIIGTIAQVCRQSAFNSALILDSSGRNKEKRKSDINKAKYFYK